MSPTARHRILVGSLALTAFVLGCRIAARAEEDKPQVVPPAPRWDQAAADQFAKAGVAVPRTVMTVETDRPLDLAWIRKALGFAEPLTGTELARIEGASGGDREAEESGSAPESAPRPQGRSESNGRRDAAPAPSASPPPPSPPPSAPSAGRPSAPGGGGGDRAPARAPAMEPSAGAAPGGAPQDQAADEKASDGATETEAPQPVLSHIETTARIGKILCENAQGGYDALEPRALRVVTFIDGPRARTVVDIVFRNPHDRRLEGTFYYPLPDGATPAGFGMFPASARVADPSVLGKASLLPALAGSSIVPTDLALAAPSRGGSGLVSDWQRMQQARVVEQKRARQVYEAVVRGRQDPALMEWTGANTFKARVFPLEPLGLKRVVICYEQTLVQDGAALRYLYPMPGDATLGPVEAVVHIRAGSELVAGLHDDASSLRTPTSSDACDGWTRLHFTAPAGFKGALDLALKANASPALTGPCELGGRAFFARVVPEVPKVDVAAPTGRGVFLVDTSLSEDGLRRSLSGQLLLKTLEKDPTIEEYAVLLFDVRARWLHGTGWRKNTPEMRAETAHELERVYFEGATNFAAVLDELIAQKGWIDEGRPATRFLLSDGLVTWGQDHVDALLASHHDALAGRFVTYRIGDAPVNRDLYDALSRATTGRTVDVLTAEQIDAAAVAHRASPVVLKAVRVAGATDLVVAGDPKLVFPGQALEVGGRLTADGPATLEVVLDVAGQEQVTSVALDAAGTSPLAARAWAELYTRKLTGLDDERLDRMVVAISQTFMLANQAASLLILESEADYQRYDVKKESVDLTDLERLRASEEDQRRDRLQGIALDEVSPEGRALVRMLNGHHAPATQPALPLLDRPLAGGAPRMQAEVEYRAGRAKDGMDVKVYDKIARARAIEGDTFGAIRALSCLVEQRPREAEANRLVGYACLALGQYGVASELFERVRLNRPFEPQSYLEEALALEAAGRWGEAARNYEILAAHAFPRHDHECKVAGAYHYARMLLGRIREGALEPAQAATLQARVKQLQATADGDDFARRALQLTIHWNTDSTDIDLWVCEPEGERCFYGHPRTAAGGYLHWDCTTGYGPELYHRGTGGKGTFDMLIHYYGNNSARLGVPTAVLFVRDRDVFGPEDGFSRRFQMRLLPESQAVLRLRQESF